MTYDPSSAIKILAGAAENELLGDENRHIRLITDGSSTGGALSTMRVKLGAGDPGALPHTHRRCTETFFVLSGVAEILAGDEVIEAREGDQVVVPTDLAHAFGASRRSGCEMLVIFTPGLDRFDYFRTLTGIQAGKIPPERLAEIAPDFDTFFLASDVWEAARNG